MNCEEFEARLHLDSLTEQEKAEMEKHAANCPECLMKSDLMALMQDAEVPQSASEAWRRAVLEEAGENRIRKQSFWTHTAAFAASLVFLCAGAFGISRWSLKNSSQPDDAASGTGPEFAQFYASESAPLPTSILGRDTVSGAAGLFKAEVTSDYATDSEFDEAVSELSEAFEAESSGMLTDKIIQNADVQIATMDFEGDLKLIEKAAEVLSGFISSSQREESAAGRRRASLTIRVPAENLGSYLDSFSSLAGKVIRRDVSTDTAAEQVDSLYTSGPVRTEDMVSEAPSATGDLGGSDPDGAISFSTITVTLTEEMPDH